MKWRDQRKIMGRTCTSKREEGRDKCYQTSARCLSIIIISLPYIGKPPSHEWFCPLLLSKYRIPKGVRYLYFQFWIGLFDKTRRDIRRRFFIISDISAVTCRFPEASPVKTLLKYRYIHRYLICILSKTRGEYPLADRPPPRLVYPPQKREKIKSSKVRYLYASSCEYRYLAKQSIIPPPSSLFSFTRKYEQASSAA